MQALTARHLTASPSSSPSTHGARPAIALGAAFLGAGAAQRVAEIIEDGAGGIGVLDLDHLAVQEEADHLGLPAAIQAPSRWRSARVMRVGLPSGITSVSTATALIRADAALTCSQLSSAMPRGGGFTLWQAAQWVARIGAISA